MESYEMGNKIHEIYEWYANSQGFNEVLMDNSFDIDWLEGKLDPKDYRKLEDYMLEFCSRNDETLFSLGFRFAWSLFHECEGQGTVGGRN